MDCRPSSSYMWSRCAAQPLFSSRSPKQPESDAAREGTCAAWVADCVLKGDAGSAADMTGETHANGWLVTPDMVEQVQGYVDLVKGRGGVTTAEQFVRLSEHIAGTFDSSTSSTTGTLHVDDLKYGMKIVEAWENTQVIIYGAAELLRLNDPFITHVTLGIYQPRAFHPEGIYRTWTLTVAELMEHAERLIQASLRCQDPQPIATPGSHCEYCDAATSCTALAHSNYAAYSVIEARTQRHMTAEELARELEFLTLAEDMLKARKSATEAEAEERMKTEHIPGWHMKDRKGHRKFTVDPDVVQMLTGVNPYKQVVMTPAEFEKEAPGLVKAVEHLARAPVIGRKLARVPRNYFNKLMGDTPSHVEGK